MIKQYFEYKRNQVEKLLINSAITKDKKQNIIEEYNKWLKENLKQDSKGRIIVNKTISEELIKLIQEKKISLVIDKYDTFISVDIDMPNSDSYQRKLFQEISEIVAIHKTPIPPVKDTIFTQENSGLTNNLVFRDPISETDHKVPYIVGNDTIHFTLNCVVQNHDVGNDWDSYKYAVMIRLDKLDKTKILDVKSEDTYIDGNAELGDDYYIFCPLGEREQIMKSNPHATIIEYEGISLNQAVESMIIYSGIKLEPYGPYGWGRHSEFYGEISDNTLLNKLLELKKYPNLQGQFGSLMHSETKYMSRRMWKREYEALISLLEYNKKHNINMPIDIIILVLMVGGAYSLPGTVPVSIESYKEYVIPILEKHRYQVKEELFEGIDPFASGMKYIYTYPSKEGIMKPAIECPDWENELRNRIINLIIEKNINYSNGSSHKNSKI